MDAAIERGQRLDRRLLVGGLRVVDVLDAAAAADRLHAVGGGGTRAAPRRSPCRSTPAARAAAAAPSAFSRLCVARAAGRAPSRSAAASAAVNHTRAPGAGQHRSAQRPRSSSFEHRDVASAWFSNMRSLQRAYASSVPCRSRWSGVTFSSTPTRQRSSSTSSSWKLESSQTIQASPAPAGRRAPTAAWPTLPATSHGTPPASSIAPSRLVVVVLPFVPVMPAIGFSGSIRAASSTSLQTGTPAARARGHRRHLARHSGALDKRRQPRQPGRRRPPGRCSTPKHVGAASVSTSALASVASTSASRPHAGDAPRTAARPERRRPPPGRGPLSSVLAEEQEVEDEARSRRRSPP